MNIAHFDDLLQAARSQPQPQRLLMVFVAAQLPPDASAAQRADHQAGAGGELEPLMCVDKSPQELADFAGLAAEAQAQHPGWALVFAGALSGVGGQAPAEAVVDAALERMLESVRAGRLSGLIPFDRQGQAVNLN